VSAVERLRGELAGLVAEHEATVARVTSTHEQQTRWEEKLARARELVNRQRTSLEAARETKAATTVALSRLQDTVAQLRLQLDQTDAKTPKLQQIEHRITPIGQTVTGRELHFQVLGNRVALIPLEPLIDRLKDQIERRKDWLAKSRQHMGQVGPVGGFSMNYVVQRDNMSVVDEVRLGGQGMFRISVSSWQLQPERDLVTESVAQALEPGSRFYAALLEAGDAAALTFWVYPDSFEAFSDLKRFCHSQNFLVAGRPLPHGVPISGSPTGSRSAGQ
jgi:multidrug efflux pump subunit AcrA (membrane-fusion protein)